MKAGVLVNRKLHWADTALLDRPSYKTWRVICIDLTDGKWGKVEQPCYGEGVDFDSTLGVLESDLSVFCNYHRIHADELVWKENGVKESWTKMFTIHLRYDPIGYQGCPIFCLPNKDWAKILQQRCSSLLRVCDGGVCRHMVRKNINLQAGHFHCDRVCQEIVIGVYRYRVVAEWHAALNGLKGIP
ncbi:hypothetical protein CQW23_22834 [Capsicum baccatum]|uniref:F-box associated domain-containing protein n=1 Tax=Capsicum baccatum TaxID=33114 RepID=A0A2G2W210_CAPBA|nr:hypothetical protein CQW23_22834 [Capsicum baccatum]